MDGLEAEKGQTEVVADVGVRQEDPIDRRPVDGSSRMGSHRGEP
jgi:hypothetical protein